MPQIRSHPVFDVKTGYDTIAAPVGRKDRRFASSKNESARAMYDFLRGWRRKKGVITLVTACLILGAWLRSLRTFDSLFVHGDQWRYGISSVDGRIWFINTTPLLGESWVAWNSREHQPEFDPMDGANVNWRRDGAGFHIGTYTRPIPSQTASGKFEAFSLMIPYGVIELPLALLSAYLIVLKPRTRSATTSTQMAADANDNAETTTSA